MEEVRPKSERSFCWYSIVMGCAGGPLVWADGTLWVSCIPHIVMPSPLAEIWVVVSSVSLARAWTFVVPRNCEMQPMKRTEEEP